MTTTMSLCELRAASSTAVSPFSLHGSDCYPCLRRGLSIDRAKQRLVLGHNLYSGGPWLRVSRGYRGLALAPCAVREAVQRHGTWVLRRGVAGRHGPLQAAGDLQHRPRLPVYERGVHAAQAPQIRANQGSLRAPRSTGSPNDSRALADALSATQRASAHSPAIPGGLPPHDSQSPSCIPLYSWIKVGHAPERVVGR